MGRSRDVVMTQENRSAMISGLKARATNECVYCGAPTTRRVCNSRECQNKSKNESRKLRVAPPSHENTLIARRRAEAEVAKVREAVGLPPLKSGMTECRRCHGEFYSWDSIKNQHCPTCLERINALDADGVSHLNRISSRGSSRPKHK